jgi:DNA-binding response OmpR family regulator
LKGVDGMQNDKALAGLRILVVEDEPVVAWDLADTLESHGCEVVGPAYDLKQAQTLSQGVALSGAVLDVNLGGEKVFPLADDLAAGEVPFCFVTGYGPQGLRPDDLGRPILQKPVDPEAIVRTVESWRSH